MSKVSLGNLNLHFRKLYLMFYLFFFCVLMNFFFLYYDNYSGGCFNHLTCARYCDSSRNIVLNSVSPMELRRLGQKDFALFWRYHRHS